MKYINSKKPIIINGILSCFQGDEWMMMCSNKMLVNLPDDIRFEFNASVKTMEPKQLQKFLKVGFSLFHCF